MSNRLKFDEFLPYAPEELGAEVHIHHCKDGHNNDRLYIRRTDDGDVLAYCHHCGKSGYFMEDYVRKQKFKRARQNSRNTTSGNVGNSEGSSSITKHGTIPADGTTDFSEWPSQARVWIYKAGLSESDTKRFGICYSPKRQRVIIPSYLDNGKLLGYQSRRVFKEDPKPKYLTKKFDKYMLWAYNSGRDTCTIVEDVLSAIRVSKYTDTVALLGSDINDYILLYILNNNYTNINIWLDNDNYIVNNNKLSIYNKLKVYINNVNIINIKNDPKNLSDRELSDILI